MASKEDLEIGQVIYIVSDKSGNVIPAIVAEEVVIKTLEGNSTSWKLFVGPQTSRQIIDSRKITGDVYSTIEEVGDVLQDRLSEFINGTIAETKQRAKKWYGVYVDESDKKNALMSSMMDETGKIDADQLLETVDRSENETQSIPSKASTAKQQKTISTSRRPKTAKEKLREAFGSDEEALLEATEQKQQALPDQNGIVKKIVKGPDGQPVEMQFQLVKDEQGNVGYVPL
jgi:hypothetical protein